VMKHFNPNNPRGLVGAAWVLHNLPISGSYIKKTGDTYMCSENAQINSANKSKG